MAEYNAVNYAAQYVAKPSEKVPPGEFHGRRRVLRDEYVLVGETSSVGLNATDTILGPKLPAGARVLDAWVKVDKSVGATGIFDLGYAANGVDVLDADAFVTGADAGGQAAFERACDGQVNAGIDKKFTVETQLLVTCTEVMDDSVVDAVLSFCVEYVID